MRIIRQNPSREHVASSEGPKEITHNRRFSTNKLEHIVHAYLTTEITILSIFDYRYRNRLPLQTSVSVTAFDA